LGALVSITVKIRNMPVIPRKTPRKKSRALTGVDSVWIIAGTTDIIAR